MAHKRKSSGGLMRAVRLSDELGEVLAFAGEGLLVGFGVFDGFVD